MKKRGVQVEVYQDASGEWRWRMQAANGRIVGASTEGYINHADCMDNLYLVTGFGLSLVDRFMYWLAKDSK